MDVESATLFAVQVQEGITMIPLTGQFGWTGMPSAFGVPSRALGRLVKRDLQPLHATADAYVDDVVEVAPAATIAAAQAVVHEHIPHTFGVGALSLK